MAVRRISRSLFSRNRSFWEKRRRCGDEIRVTRMRRVISVLSGLRRRFLSTT
jgi:hypothetical protein